MVLCGLFGHLFALLSFLTSALSFLDSLSFLLFRPGPLLLRSGLLLPRSLSHAQQPPLLVVHLLYQQQRPLQPPSRNLPVSPPQSVLCLSPSCSRARPQTADPRSSARPSAGPPPPPCAPSARGPAGRIPGRPCSAGRCDPCRLSSSRTLITVISALSTASRLGE